MAAGDQVFSPHPGAVYVGRQHSVSTPVGHSAVISDDRGALVDQLADLGCVRFRRGDYGPSYSLGCQHTQVIALLGWILVRVAQHDAVATAVSSVLNRPDHLGEMGVLYIRYNDADHLRLLATQVAGRPVGAVPEFVDGGEDVLALRFSNGRAAVQDTRNSGWRHPGPLGYFSYA